MDKLTIIILSISLSVACVLIFILLFYKFYYAKHRKLNLIKDIDRRYQYYHVLLTGQCLQIIRRLEIISRSNLVYATYYTEFLKRHKSIENKNDQIVEKAIYSLNDYISDSKKQGFKESYNYASEQLNSYIKEVDSLNETLLKIIKPEEDTRSIGLKIKEQFGAARKKFINTSSNYHLAIQSFDKIFSKIENKFSLFETLIDSANYEEAISLLEPIKLVLSQLNIAMDELPAICANYETLLPTKISYLKEKYELTTHEDIPTFNIISFKTFSSIDNRMENILKLIKKLSTNHAKIEIEETFSLIDKLLKELEHECESKSIYNEKYKIIYDNSNKLENKVIKIYNDIPKIRKYYIFNEEYINISTVFDDYASKLSSSKRKLDNYVHAQNKQPYSLLLEKLEDLDIDSKRLENKMLNYEAYIKSLKLDCENAYNLVFKSTLILKENEVLLNTYNIIPEFLDSYKYSFSRAYQLLNEIYNATNSKPINVIDINLKVIEFKAVFDNIISSIDEITHLRKECISLFIQLNSMQEAFKTIDEELKGAYNLFNNSNFSSCYETLKRLAIRHNGVESH